MRGSLSAVRIAECLIEAIGKRAFPFPIDREVGRGCFTTRLSNLGINYFPAPLPSRTNGRFNHERRAIFRNRVNKVEGIVGYQHGYSRHIFSIYE